MSLRGPIRYARGAVRPECWLWLYDDDDALLDLSTGFTFEVRIGHLGVAAQLEKTSDVTGQVGSTTTPNLRIAWTAGELDFDPGEYILQVMVDGGGTTPRYFFEEFELGDIVLAP